MMERCELLGWLGFGWLLLVLGLFLFDLWKFCNNNGFGLSLRSWDGEIIGVKRVITVGNEGARI